MGTVVLVAISHLFHDPCFFTHPTLAAFCTNTLTYKRWHNSRDMPLLALVPARLGQEGDLCPLSHVVACESSTLWRLRLRVILVPSARRSMVCLLLCLAMPNWRLLVQQCHVCHSPPELDTGSRSSSVSFANDECCMNRPRTLVAFTFFSSQPQHSSCCLRAYPHHCLHSLHLNSYSQPPSSPVPPFPS